MPGSVAVAIVHGTDQVFVAEDEETLSWVLALRLIARTDASDLSPQLRADLRAALLEERWGDAVVRWMSENGDAVDVYPSYDFFRSSDVELGAQELQFSPLFRDE